MSTGDDRFGEPARLGVATVYEAAGRQGLVDEEFIRLIRVRGATKTHRGAIDRPVVVGGAVIRPGDAVVMDGDGVVVVAADRVDDVLVAGRAREGKEAEARREYLAGGLSYDLHGFRAADEGGAP